MNEIQKHVPYMDQVAASPKAAAAVLHEAMTGMLSTPIGGDNPQPKVGETPAGHRVELVDDARRIQISAPNQVPETVTVDVLSPTAGAARRLARGVKWQR